MIPAKVSLEERVAQLQLAQRRQREGWADRGWCEDCGSDEAVESITDGYTDTTRLCCRKCQAKRAGIEVPD